jgi:hypothetical protein
VRANHAPAAEMPTPLLRISSLVPTFFPGSWLGLASVNGKEQSPFNNNYEIMRCDAMPDHQHF